MVVIWIQEKPASTLGHEFVESLPTSGSSPGIPLVGENVNRRSRPLAHVDDIVDASMAGVINSVSKQQDEVAGHRPTINIPPVTTSLIERIED